MFRKVMVTIKVPSEKDCYKIFKGSFLKVLFVEDDSACIELLGFPGWIQIPVALLNFATKKAWKSEYSCTKWNKENIKEAP